MFGLFYLFASFVRPFLFGLFLPFLCGFLFLYLWFFSLKSQKDKLLHQKYSYPYLGTDSTSPLMIFARFCPSRRCCDDQNSSWRPHQTTLTVQNTQFVDTNFVQIRQKTNFTYSQNSQNHLFWLNNRNNQAYEIIARVLH